VKAAILTGAGRPLRVLVLMALAGVIWLATRVPDVAARYDAVVAGMDVPVSPEVTIVAPVVMPTVAAIVPRPQRARLRPAAVSVRHASPLRSQPTTAPPPLALDPPPLALDPPPMSAAFSPAAAAVAARTAPAVPESTTPAIPGFDLATAAYARLAVADRRGADTLFTSALAAAAGQDVPQVADWARAQRQLRRRWSGDAYSLLRDSGLAGPAASPVLGGGQSGASLAYSLDPLARQPLAVFGRIYAAHDAAASIDPASAQAAIGLRWQLRPGVSIAAERLIAIGAATSGDWNLRLAAGGARRLGPVAVDGYGEAGVRGNGDLYAGGEAHARAPIGKIGAAQLAAGPGAWGSVQSAGATVARLDVGAGISAPLPAGVVVSGPAVTMGVAF
jgi:hypothetical protein